MRRVLWTLVLAACLGLVPPQGAGAEPAGRPISVEAGMARAEPGVLALLERLYARLWTIFGKSGPSMDPWG